MILDRKRLYESIFDFIFNINPEPMKQHYPFWLRFSFFFIIFSVAFFFIIFLMESKPSENFKLLVIKICALAGVSSLLYNVLLESDPEIVD